MVLRWSVCVFVCIVGLVIVGTVQSRTVDVGDSVANNIVSSSSQESAELDAEARQPTGVVEGRGKMIKKMMLPFLMGIVLKVTTLLPIILGVLFMMGGLAVTVASIAFTIAGLVALHQLIHSHSKGSHKVVPIGDHQASGSTQPATYALPYTPTGHGHYQPPANPAALIRRVIHS